MDSKKDRGLCGVYTHEIAETKVMQVIKKAQDNAKELYATIRESLEKHDEIDKFKLFRI